MSRSKIPDERRSQIIAGALKVFSTKGFANATNKDIAEAAGIQSAGLIYHYFEDKAALLRTVIESHAPPLVLFANTDRLMALPAREGLTMIASTYLEIMNSPTMIDFLRILLGEALRDRKFAKTLSQIGPLRIWKLVTEYLSSRMDAGELRRCDAGQLAWAFMGGLFVHIFAGRLLDIEEARIDDKAAMVEQHVALFMAALRPDSAQEGAHEA